MRGLRTQEGEKFNRFFQLVQDEAEKHGCVFFLDAGDGRELFRDDIEGEDLMGWLVPNNKSEAFEKEWKDFNANLDSWMDLFTWAEWEEADGQIKIVFNNHSY